MQLLPDTTSLFIDGRWVAPSRRDTLAVVNPVNEQVLTEVPNGASADVDSAVRAARRALPAWSSTTPGARAEILWALQKLLKASRGRMADLIVSEVGTPQRVAEAIQVDLPISILGSFAQLLENYQFRTEIGDSLVVREPIGVVGAITPWNYPLHQTIAKVIPALAAGCTVVHKPSEVAPLSAFVLAQLLSESGLPDGVFNLVSGTGADVGEPLVRHSDVDMISFTGSTDAGRRVGTVAAETVKRVSLELGGKSANIVLDDADLEVAVKAGVKNAFLNTGQTCTALSRLLVHKDQYDSAVAIAVATAESLEARLGPVTTSAQWDRVQQYLEIGVAEGAVLATGGPGLPIGRTVGYYCRPTVFTNVTSSMRIAQEEIFGPVLCVIAYTDDEQAVEIANDTTFGLAAAVWSSSTDRAVDLAGGLRVGQVDINGAPFNILAPFGGYGQSGNGRELGVFGFEEFLEIKSVQLPRSH